MWGLGSPSVGLELSANPTRPPPWTVCVPHRDTVCVPHRHCVCSTKGISDYYTKGISDYYTKEIPMSRSMSMSMPMPCHARPGHVRHCLCSAETEPRETQNALATQNSGLENSSWTIHPSSGGFFELRISLEGQKIQISTFLFMVFG